MAAPFLARFYSSSICKLCWKFSLDTHATNIFILQIFSFTCSFCSLLHASSSLYSVSLFFNFLIFIFDPPNVFCLSLTSDDEMCNFYIMYWTDGGQALKKKQCFSLGPPLFTWSRYLLNNIPNEDASTL